MKILLECEVDEKTPYTLTEKLHGRNRHAEGEQKGKQDILPLDGGGSRQEE